jgi:hypothetical protein
MMKLNRGVDLSIAKDEGGRVMRVIVLCGGACDGMRTEARDGQPDAKPGAVIHIPSGRPDNLYWAYEVRQEDPTRADYLGAGYFGMPGVTGGSWSM